MFDVAAKASFGFVVLLALLGVIPMQPIAESLMLFIMLGLVPGTELAVPPDFVLFVVAAIMMAFATLFFRRYFEYRALLDKFLPQYTRSEQEDPALQTLLPALGRTLALGKSAMTAANNASVEFYFWLRSLGRPVIAQAVHVRRGLTTTLVRFDRWESFKATILQKLETLNGLVRQWIEKARYYVVRFTTR